MFPLLYHAHHVRYTEDLPFWAGLAAQAGGPVLELGCGTGRVAQHLSRLEHTVYGLDLDAAMLRTLRQVIPRNAPLAKRIFQADLAAFHLAQSFALIIVPCNTWSTLSPATRQAALQRVRAHLRPGGCFAVSLPNPALFHDLPARSGLELEDSFPHPLDGAPVQVFSGWRRTAQAFTVTWRYDHRRPDGQLEQVEARTRHALLPAQAYLDELTQAGLALTTAYGDFAGKPYDEAADDLIIISKLVP
jgi:SAM-dependent methyltransferase